MARTPPASSILVASGRRGRRRAAGNALGACVHAENLSKMRAMRGLPGGSFEVTFGVAEWAGAQDGGVTRAMVRLARGVLAREHFGPGMRYIWRGRKGMQAQRLTAI